MALKYTPSIHQILRVWTELDDAYHGKGRYRQTVAEIYAYWLQPCIPSELKDKEIGSEINKQSYNALIEILELFLEMRRCQIKVDDVPLDLWKVQNKCFMGRVKVDVLEKCSC